MRVVSLVPSVTETLLAWGVDVVACTRFCEQPQLAHVGGTKDPDVAAIVALQPDLVVLDREENRRDDAEQLTTAGVPLHVTQVVHIDQVSATLGDLAAAVHVSVDRFDLPPPAARRADAFVPIWRRPWMTINDDTYGASVLAHLGIGNVFGDRPERYPTVTLADAAQRHPACVLLPSEPYPFKQRHAAELARALPAATVHLIDGADLFWWGVRTPDALTRLRARIGG